MQQWMHLLTQQQKKQRQNQHSVLRLILMQLVLVL